MKNPRRVDQNIIGVFNQTGFTVDLIKDIDVRRTDFSKYKIIFLGDERVRNAAKYLEMIDNSLGVPLKYVGVGPEREQIIDS